MGVKGLVSFLRLRAPQAFAPLPSSELAGLRVGIDLSVSLYKGAAAAYKWGPLAHLELLCREVAWLHELGCEPIYVLDGAAPPQKAEEAARREETRAAAERRFQQALERLERDPEDGEAQGLVFKLQKQCTRLPAGARADAEALLQALGVATLQAPGEAERCLAHLQRAGRIDHIFTEDVDVLLCGARSYVKNYASLRRDPAFEQPHDKGAELVNLAGALEGLELDYEAFVAVGMLSGCDFAPKLPRLGPATAWKLVRRCGDLGKCFDALPGAVQELRGRYLSAWPLMAYNPAEALPPTPAPRAPRRSELERLLERLERQGCVATLRACLDRCLERNLPEEPAAKRARLEPDA